MFDLTLHSRPLRPGLPERQTRDYMRHGITSRFTALEVATDKVIGQCLPRHRRREFVRFLGQVEKEVPPELNVHLIRDNYSTQKTPWVLRWLKPKKKATVPLSLHPHQQRLAQPSERFFTEITRKQIRRGSFRSVRELEKALYQYLATWNQRPAPFVWKATANVILHKVSRCRELAGTAT